MQVISLTSGICVFTASTLDCRPPARSDLCTPTWTCTDCRHQGASSFVGETLQKAADAAKDVNGVPPTILLVLLPDTGGHEGSTCTSTLTLTSALAMTLSRRGLKCMPSCIPRQKDLDTFVSPVSAGQTFRSLMPSIGATRHGLLHPMPPAPRPTRSLFFIYDA